MFAPRDLASRFKSLRQHQQPAGQKVADIRLRGWFFILLFTILGTVAVFVFSFYRYLAWSDLDRMYADREVSAGYDDGKLQAILEDFAEKDEATDALLRRAVAERIRLEALIVASSTAISTAASTASSSVSGE